MLQESWTDIDNHMRLGWFFFPNALPHSKNILYTIPYRMEILMFVEDICAQ